MLILLASCGFVLVFVVRHMNSLLRGYRRSASGATLVRSLSNRVSDNPPFDRLFYLVIFQIISRPYDPLSSSKYRSRLMPEVRRRFLMINTGTALYVGMTSGRRTPALT